MTDIISNISKLIIIDPLFNKRTRHAEIENRCIFVIQFSIPSNPKLTFEHAHAVQYYFHDERSDAVTFILDFHIPP